MASGLTCFRRVWARDSSSRFLRGQGAHAQPQSRQHARRAARGHARLEVIERLLRRRHVGGKLVIGEGWAAWLPPELANVGSRSDRRRRGQHAVVAFAEHGPGLPPADAHVGGGGEVRARLLSLRHAHGLASWQPRLQQLAEDAELPRDVAPVRWEQHRRQPRRRAPVLGHVAVQLRYRVGGAARMQQQRDDLEVAPLRECAALVPALPAAWVCGLGAQRAGCSQGSAAAHATSAPQALEHAPRSRPAP